jgi:hypothetical protein
MKQSAEALIAAKRASLKEKASGGCEFAQSSGSTHVMPLLLSNPCPNVDLCHALCLHIRGKVKRCIIEVLRREMGAAQTKSWGQEVFDLEYWDAVVLLQGKDCLRKDPF